MLVWRRERSFARPVWSRERYFARGIDGSVGGGDTCEHSRECGEFIIGELRGCVLQTHQSRTYLYTLRRGEADQRVDTRLECDCKCNDRGQRWTQAPAFSPTDGIERDIGPLRELGLRDSDRTSGGANPLAEASPYVFEAAFHLNF